MNARGQCKESLIIEFGCLYISWYRKMYLLRQAQLLEMGTLISRPSVPLPAGAGWFTEPFTNNYALQSRYLKTGSAFNINFTKTTPRYGVFCYDFAGGS